MRRNERVLPISYERRGWYSSHSYFWEEVVFLEDWGPIKAGSKLFQIVLDYSSHNLRIYDKCSNEIGELPYVVSPLFDYARTNRSTSVDVDYNTSHNNRQPDTIGGFSKIHYD